jgi:RsiW-degrading membrane proteinase PrsW (M82 family)
MSGVVIALAVGLLIPLTLMVLLVEERETKVLLSFFSWGTVSGVLAFYLNSFAVDTFDVSSEAARIGYAPIIEEFTKALPLFVLLFLLPSFMRRKEVILASVFSGIGFSVVENYVYMIQRVDQDAFAVVQVVLTRSFSSTIMHGVATGMVGVSFYYILNGTFDELRVRYVLIPVSYSFAVIFHALYNLYVLFGRLGQTVAVVGVILLYTGAWLFIDIYYGGLDEGDDLPAEAEGQA